MTDDSESGPTTSFSEMEVSSSLLSSPPPYSKDGGAPPSTPSSISTDTSSNSDRAEAPHLVSPEASTTTAGEMSTDMANTLSASVYDDDDDDLPSDEEKEYAKNANANTNDTGEIPWDEVKTFVTANVAVVEDDTNSKSSADEHKGEAFMEEIVVQNDDDDESPLKSEPDTHEEGTINKDYTENTGESTGEEVAAVQCDHEEIALPEVNANEPLPSESPSKDASDTEDPVQASSSVDEKDAETATVSTKPQLEIDVSNNDDDDDQTSNGSDDKEEESAPTAAKITPRSGGISFAQAFSTTPLPPPLYASPSLASVSETPSNASPANNSPSSSNNHQEESEASTLTDTHTSHSALSASRNKKASGLISKYQEKVAHETLPGDAVPLRSPSQKSNSYSTDVSPGTARILQQKAVTTFVELNSLPDMHSVRAKFEKSARKSPLGNFEFGESFRQKQRIDQLSEKEREEEAKVAMRGFNEKILNEGRTASGEIDTSNLPKSFTFDMSSTGFIMPNDGVCRVDYINADFRAKVFVVHKTRGMLLLQDKHATPSSSKKKSKKKNKKKSTVPGGKVSEDEFLAAATESGSPQVQLQIAAREAAARHVYETTGLDIRKQADRLKPAVLVTNPSMNAARGYQYLRNENEENLYYFLQVDEDDFEKLKADGAQEQGGDGDDNANANDTAAAAPATTTKLTRPSEDSGDDLAAPTKSTRPSEDSGDDQAAPTKLKRPSEDLGDEPVTLKLSSDYSGYEFVQDPVHASKVLKKDGNDAAIALAMIMSAASQEINGPSAPSQDDNAMKDPDAKAKEYADKNSMLDDELDDDDENQPNDGTVRTIGATDNKKSGDEKSFRKEEAEINIHIKTSGDTADDMVGVGCCCSFW